MGSHTTKVAAIAMYSVMADPRANLTHVEDWVRKAHDKGASFALFTKECITGSMNKSDMSLAQIREIAEEA